MRPFSHLPLSSPHRSQGAATALTRRLVVLGALNTLAGCGSLMEPTEPPATSVEVIPVDQARALALTNAIRAQNGAGPLVADGRVLAAAEEMALIIARAGRLRVSEHSSSSLVARLRGHGLEVDAAAENLGGGYASFELALDGWEASSGHRANLLNPRVTHAAVARVDRRPGRWVSYWAMIYVAPRSV